MTSLARLILYCCAAFFLTYLPFINIPLLYLSTTFHELSHGIMTLLTGGQIIEFSLSLNGAGHLVSRGGSSWLIAVAGYAGTPLFGGLLYLVGPKPNLAKFIISFVALILMVTIVFWLSDLTTLFILTMMLSLLGCLLIKRQSRVLTWLIQFIGIVVLMNAITNPLHLIDGHQVGDGAILARVTGLPEIVWVFAWCGWGCFILFKLASLEFNRK
ncbi:M50 family metallopeptidase [Psychrobium sp. 1_MG-2023]|uniref:M50 family metallopeptidase n=1 Tax=Psychrobium sp. 1_MG-2023 TaxID=3062624 RepID=UPI000C321416|nr:M50 family metallopeptidase [Psychrobium sp. 1_MG-2023]MDP2562192.1 M50 family metallopeptidase [Psychrobium sp. 1_MG-2023]PKF58105.1 hypothetical protein CW748_04705 [Alteromonadales bacterium alter-6D02]